MSSERIHERELFERYVKQRAPGANLQRIGGKYVDIDVQWHFETWLARADLTVTICRGDCQPGDRLAHGAHVAPVAWQLRTPDERVILNKEFPAWADGIDGYKITPLYAAPQPAEQQPAPDVAGLVEALKDLLPELDKALEDLELFGLHSDQGYRKLREWYRKMMAATKAVDAALVDAPPAQPDASVLVEALRNMLSDDDIRHLRRFQEICEDSDADGHDLPKEAVRRLERAGALRSCGFGRHETTRFGDAILAALAGKGADQ